MITMNSSTSLPLLLVFVSRTLCFFASLSNAEPQQWDLQLGGVDDLEAKAPVEDNESHTTYRSCLYKKYKSPRHNSGLPFLADVFAADEGRSVYFVAINKGGCQKEWEHIQEFHSTNDKQHHFNCIFHDGTTVLSDPVHKKMKNDFAYTNAAMMIRCDIPMHLQNLVSEPSTFARLTVTLQALQSVDDSNTTAESFAGRSHVNLPVCHAEWPSFDGSVSVDPHKKYSASLMTRIASSYKDNRYGGKQELNSDHLIAWIEYHKEIGIEHFYIYDSDQERHGPIEKWLISYIQSGTVTYVHYPLKDCVRDYSLPHTKQRSRQKGSHLYTGQIAATNSAIRRYAHQTHWMGHWDVDEFLVLPPGIKTAKDLITARGGNKVDGIAFPMKCLSVCDSEYVDNSQMLPFERSECVVDKCSLEKSFYRTDRILYFVVHSAVATVQSTTPIFEHKWIVNDEDGYLAHYRTNPSMLYDQRGFEGFAGTNYTRREQALSRSLKAKVKKSVDEYKETLGHHASMPEDARSRRVLRGGRKINRRGHTRNTNSRSDSESGSKSSGRKSTGMSYSFEDEELPLWKKKKQEAKEEKNDAKKEELSLLKKKKKTLHEWKP